MLIFFAMIYKIYMKRILIIHDRFKFRGGAERLVLIIAKGLNADIATEYWNKDESFAKSEAPARVITLGRQIRHHGLSYLSAQWRFFWKTGFIKDYDIIIFSGNNCLSAAWRCKNQKKIMYCHTPVRYAYDLKDYYYEQKVWWKKPLFLLFVAMARIIYQRGINKMDKVIANSKNVQNRLKQYCGVESTVVYPPIDTEKFNTGRRHVDVSPLMDYYLSFGRVDELKRIDRIVKAFQRLPQHKLIVASGGPELEKVKKMAEGHDNIQVLGFVSDEKLVELVGNCIANIYIPKQEDFGMTPLEAGAAGKPTIGVNDGGLRETIIHKKTGYLISAECEINELVEAIKWMTREKVLEMEEDCIEQAGKFKKEIFIENVINLI